MISDLEIPTKEKCAVDIEIIDKIGYSTFSPITIKTISDKVIVTSHSRIKSYPKKSYEILNKGSWCEAKKAIGINVNMI